MTDSGLLLEGPGQISFDHFLHILPISKSFNMKKYDKQLGALRCANFV